MDMAQNLVHWAEDKGVELDGIKPQRIPGRGLGVVATRPLKAGETILTVPTEALRSLHTIPRSIPRKLPADVSIHALLAAALALDKTAKFAPWTAVLPTWADFEASTPFMWPVELQNLLPKPAKDLLKKQQAKFQQEWDSVAKVFLSLQRQDYLYAWFIVNTRTFYYETSMMKTFPHNDKLALLPVADLLNHADSGCQVSFSPESYTIVADRAYGASEEVYISYGGHSNDFLLTEYGFVLAKNRWDEVCLDEVILPNLNTTQKAELEGSGFLGRYMLDAETAGCHRTQVALRLLCSTSAQWRRFVDAGDDGEASQGKVDVLLMQMLDTFLQTIKKTMADILKLNVGQATQRELLLERWKQIQSMITQTMERLKS
ncbi:hypothetical protein MMC26_004192 [Xylographa opegraphella]|nr:hypothetical protein [Xylographa opegraphella]